MNTVPVRAGESRQSGLNLGLVIALLWCAAFWGLVAVGIDLLL